MKKLFHIETINAKDLKEYEFFVVAANTVAAINKLNQDFPDEVEHSITILASDVKKDLLHPHLLV